MRLLRKLISLVHILRSFAQLPSFGLLRTVSRSVHSISFLQRSTFHIAQIDSSSSPALDKTVLVSETEKESAHLKLRTEIIVRLEDKPADTSNTTKDIIIIHELYLQANDTIMACSLSNTADLDTFFKHLYGYNSSETDSVCFRTIKAKRNDTATFEKYLAIWHDSKMLTNRKSLLEEWTFTSQQSYKRSSLEKILLPNAKRIKVIDEDIATLRELAVFLRQQTIMNEPFEYYQFQSHRSGTESLSILKNLSIWFRDEFPYYYHTCGYCGHKQQNQYLGTVYSTKEERDYQSARTELYVCSSCGEVTRFARFNDMRKVLLTRWGRCGEYSVLMLLFLRVLGYQARWVVDRDDHVWAEALIEGNWIHIDPCEAAVNEPFIYQGWGKNQTYIFAFTSDNVEDVTFNYTTNVTAVVQRRLDEGITSQQLDELIQQVKKTLIQEKVALDVTK